MKSDQELVQAPPFLDVKTNNFLKDTTTSLGAKPGPALLKPQAQSSNPMGTTMDYVPTQFVAYSARSQLTRRRKTFQEYLYI